jgi:membrane protein YqaA with SNARE-associated domain
VGIWYLAVFFVSLGVDSIPVFAPPAWPFMVFFLLHFKLQPMWVVLFGVAGSTLGRTILSNYMPHLGKKFLSQYEGENLKFLGQQLDKSFFKSFVFVFIYSVTPLSTTVLFTAAGLARAKWRNVLPAFFLGKFVSDSVMIFTGLYAAMNIESIKDGFFSFKGICITVLTLLTFAFFLLINWRELIEKKKLSFKFDIWK